MLDGGKQRFLVPLLCRPFASKRGLLLSSLSGAFVQISRQDRQQRAKCTRLIEIYAISSVYFVSCYIHWLSLRAH